MNSQNNFETGFTLIELIVTILIAASFIITISQMIGFVGYIATTAQNDEIASNIAYNNLRSYANGQAARLWFTCNGDDTSDTNTTVPFTDTNTHPESEGYPLINTTYNSRYNNLPPPVIVKVVASAPYGCGNDVQAGLSPPSTMPIRIISTVTYGSSARKVVHATYVSY